MPLFDVDFEVRVPGASAFASPSGLTGLVDLDDDGAADDLAAGARIGTTLTHTVASADAGAPLDVAARAVATGTSPAAAELTTSPVTEDALPDSCQEIYTLFGGAASSGLYDIDPDGDGANPISAYCHMVASGNATGGWTVVARQTEEFPQSNWQGDDVTDMYRGFTLAEHNLPSDRTYMGVGRQLTDGTVELLEAVEMAYTTGDIDPMGVVARDGLKDSSSSYHVHRSATHHFAWHDPESGNMVTGDAWRNTLTFDKVGTPSAANSSFTWAFSPLRPDTISVSRGYAYDGDTLWDDQDDFAWLVFVR